MQEYRYKFYLNAIHSILINGVMGELHPHTWEITVDVFKQKNDFLAFTQIESAVEILLEPFQNKNMNTIHPFDTLNPTLENVSLYLQTNLESLFVENGFILTRLEVSETPSRSFIIDIATEDKSEKQAPFTQDTDIIEQKTEELIKERLNVMANMAMQNNNEKPKKESGFGNFLKKHKK